MGFIMKLLDLACAAVIIFSMFIPTKLILYSAVFLIVKGSCYIITRGCVRSYIYLCCGIYMLILSFGLNITVFSGISSLFLVFRGITLFA